MQDLFIRFANYGIALGIYNVIASIICLIVVILSFKSCAKKQKEIPNFTYFDEGIIESICIIFFGVFGIVAFFGGIDAILTNMFVPELYLVEYMQEFLQ